MRIEGNVRQILLFSLNFGMLNKFSSVKTDVNCFTRIFALLLVETAGKPEKIWTMVYLNYLYLGSASLVLVFTKSFDVILERLNGLFWDLNLLSSFYSLHDFLLLSEGICLNIQFIFFPISCFTGLFIHW